MAVAAKDDILCWRRRRSETRHTRETIRESLPDEVRAAMLEMALEIARVKQDAADVRERLMALQDALIAAAEHHEAQP